MGYSAAVLDRARAQFESSKAEHRASVYRYRETVFAKIPRLQEIEMELRKSVAMYIRSSLVDRSGIMADEIRNRNLLLQSERDSLIQKHNLNKRMLSEEPKCPICGDRGYVGSAMCDCFRKFCVLEQNRELTRLMATGNESFENFNLNYYPDISLDYFYATTEDGRQQPSLSKATIRHGIKRYPTYISIYEILHCSIERVSAVFNNASYSIMLLLRKS